MTPESGIRDAIAPDSSAFWTVAPTVLERRCRAVAAVDRAMTVGANEKRGRRQEGCRGRGGTFDLVLVNEGINPTSALSEAVIAELSCTPLSMG